MQNRRISEYNVAVHNGIEYLREKNYKDATISFNNAIDIDNTRYEAYSHRALLKYQTKQIQQAISDYNIALEKLKEKMKTAQELLGFDCTYINNLKKIEKQINDNLIKAELANAIDEYEQKYEINANDSHPYGLELEDGVDGNNSSDFKISINEYVVNIDESSESESKYFDNLSKESDSNNGTESSNRSIISSSEESYTSSKENYNSEHSSDDKIIINEPILKKSVSNKDNKNMINPYTGYNGQSSSSSDNDKFIKSLMQSMTHGSPDHNIDNKFDNEFDDKYHDIDDDINECIIQDSTKSTINQKPSNNLSIFSSAPTYSRMNDGQALKLNNKFFNKK